MKVSRRDEKQSLVTVSISSHTISSDTKMVVYTIEDEKRR